MNWEIVHTGSASAKENMEWDRHHLDRLDPGSPPLLRFYAWDSPCLTYGYFVDPWKEIDPRSLKERGWASAKRPTGGGITLHEEDFPYSIFLSRSHPWYLFSSDALYAEIHARVLRALEACFSKKKWRMASREEVVAFPPSSFCLESPVLHDVLCEGKKIGGGALRRTKKGLLFQGFLAGVSSQDDGLVKAMANSVAGDLKER